VKAKSIVLGILMVVLGAAFGTANLYDDPEPICRPNQVCPTSGPQKGPICLPGKPCVVDK
jgi:hypothetical protein